jgi:bacteriorhodopsin
VRALALLLGVIIVLIWLGYEAKNPQLRQVFYAFAALLTVLLVGAFFGLYGR